MITGRKERQAREGVRTTRKSLVKFRRCEEVNRAVENRTNGLQSC